MTKEEAKKMGATHYRFVDDRKEYYRGDGEGFWCRLIQRRKVWTWIRDKPNDIEPL